MDIQQHRILLEFKVEATGQMQFLCGQARFLYWRPDRLGFQDYQEWDVNHVSTRAMNHVVFSAISGVFSDQR